MKHSLIVSIFCFLLVLGSGQTLGVEDVGGGFDHIAKVKTNSPTSELFLDSTVKSIFADISATLTLWQSNHFTFYLFTVSILTGLSVGLMTSLLAHYGCDPRAIWKNVWKKSTWLAAACGLGTSILLVAVMLPMQDHGRLTYLVLSAAACSSSAALGCSLCFVLARRIRQRRGARSGLIFNQERMQGF